MRMGTELENNQIYIDVMYFNSVMFVCLIDKLTSEFKVYTNLVSEGNSEERDIKQCASYGLKFPIEAGAKLFDYIDYSKE